MSIVDNTKQAIAAISQANDQTGLGQLRVKYLGRKGWLTEQLKGIAKLPPAKRSQTGAQLNTARQQIEQAIKRQEHKLKQLQLTSIQQLPLDLTVPALVNYGHLHPVSQTVDEVVRLFWQMGYKVADGPEIEDEWHNFDALNMNPDHPARDMQDTFYLEGGNLPRTHTSSVQIRYMKQNQPPIRIIAPGKAYRNEDEDPRHVWMFHQVEGLVVDAGISLADLKGTLLVMLQGLLGDDTGVRLRPNFFPYTEPSIEVDATCIVCSGKNNDCRTCGGTGWLELGGSGMVHPQVLRNVGIDPDVYSGFAFGFGLERLASIKYDVPDLREFWRPNLKFLEQF